MIHKDWTFGLFVCIDKASRRTQHRKSTSNDSEGGKGSLSAVSTFVNEVKIGKQAQPFPLERAGKTRLAFLIVPLAIVYVLTAPQRVLTQNACRHL